MNDLQWLELWYTGQCDGSWEHEYGITIETLDNPGWRISMNMNDTPWENKEFAPVNLGMNLKSFITIKKENGIIEAACGPLQLQVTLARIKDWIEEGKKTMKCKTLNCTNQNDEGVFIGEFCAPCYDYITTQKGRHSQAYRNDKFNNLIDNNILMVKALLYFVRRVNAGSIRSHKTYAYYIEVIEKVTGKSIEEVLSDESYK